MGKYKAAVITTGGQNLIAQALANEQPLVFTSAKTSSYSYPVGTDIPALTGLQDVLQTVLPFDSKVLGGNVAQVSVRFDNDGVDQTYRIETIGLYAKIEGGEEILFSVTQAITPDEMPVQSDVSPSAYIYNIQHTVQNASQITLTVNPAGTATVQDIMDIKNPAFDDSGTVEEISSFPSFLETMKSKMNFFQFFRNLKAGLQFVLHAGQIVNSCVSDRADLPLSAAQGKILKDLYTQLYSDMGYRILDESFSDIVTDGYLVDAAWITTTGAYTRTNTSVFRVHKDHTKNMPASCSFGVRTCRTYDKNNYIVQITEFYPVPGRIWSNKYVVGTGWSGWSDSALKSDLSDRVKKIFGTFLPGSVVLDVSTWSAITLLSLVTYRDEATALYLIRKESSDKIYCIPVKSSTQVSVAYSGENKLALTDSTAFGGTWSVLFLS